MFSPKKFYISFFIEGIDFAHWFCLEDKIEIWLTKTLFRCFNSVRLSFIVWNDSLYCSNLSFSSFISFSCLWFWAIRILSFIVTCILFLKEIKKSDLYCQFFWIFFLCMYRLSFGSLLYFVLCVVFWIHLSYCQRILFHIPFASI